MGETTSDRITSRRGPKIGPNNRAPCSVIWGGWGGAKEPQHLEPRLAAKRWQIAENLPRRPKPGPFSKKLDGCDMGKWNDQMFGLIIRCDIIMI